MYTKHATTRMQQRGISSEVVDALLCWGEEKMEKGATKYYGTKKTAQRLVEEGYPVQMAERIRGVYIVTIGGAVITVAHLH